MAVDLMVPELLGCDSCLLARELADRTDSQLCADSVAFLLEHNKAGLGLAVVRFEQAVRMILLPHTDSSWSAEMICEWAREAAAQLPGRDMIMVLATAHREAANRLHRRLEISRRRVVDAVDRQAGVL